MVHGGHLQERLDGSCMGLFFWSLQLDSWTGQLSKSQGPSFFDSFRNQPPLVPQKSRMSRKREHAELCTSDSELAVSVSVFLEHTIPIHSQDYLLSYWHSVSFQT